MRKTTLIFATLVLGAGCSHAQPKRNQDQLAQAMRSQAAGPQLAQAASTPEPATGTVQSNQDSKRNRAIYFDFDSAVLRNDAPPVLQKVATAAKRGKSVRIEGNCDDRGTTEYNLALGDARARSAEQYLERMGIPKQHIATISYGSERPKVIGHDESAWAQNRRDDLILQ